MEWACRKCLPCRLNMRRLWTSRLILEASVSPVARFVTLTFAPKFYPADGSLNPRVLVLFMKRLRKAIEPERVRFYAVGEYGENTWRAHFHVALFSRVVVDEAIRAAWVDVDSAEPLGFVDIKQVGPESAAYIAGYTVKKLTKVGDPRLKGRHPEFARMSRRPFGIGAGAVPALAKAVTSRAGAKAVAAAADVPGVIRFGGKLWPLGRYLKGRLRGDAGLDTSPQPRSNIRRDEVSRSERLARDMQAALLVPGAREVHEGKRVQTSRKVKYLHAVNQSKKRNEL